LCPITIASWSLQGYVLLKVSQAPLQRVAISILLRLGHISPQKKKKHERQNTNKEKSETSTQTDGQKST